MIQHTEIVYANEIWYGDGSIACMLDPFVLTTYVGRHAVSCEARMLGEDHGVGIVVPMDYVHGMSDLNVLHQEVMAKSLRCDATYIGLEYHEPERFMSER